MFGPKDLLHEKTGMPCTGIGNKKFQPGNHKKKENGKLNLLVQEICLVRKDGLGGWRDDY